MNELKEICDRLGCRYGTDVQFLVTKAEKTENGWNLTVQTVDKSKGAENESN